MAYSYLYHIYTVAHNKILLKLAHYGMQSNTHQWIATWLTTRSQKVALEGENLRIKGCNQEYPRELFWDPLCFCCTLMTFTQMFAHLSTFLLMIAYCIRLLKHLKTINTCNVT